ncbi:LysR substrate-binding domain-containing protein [Neorhizobium alkalisoli]|uniref:HTH-type transcriptional regulator TtuA n=1 Tax=Neorhizobium alkalisoli TaxID=528178 RepID=A0A561QWC8_9HYPH|nr:LysR substrate-binding domain-containing protein [Neorhizobium alkalisoli]TWF54684.1 LysR family glycine cleavage system transcriptional activator [Neorhizobium alkalisoli]
MKLSRRFPLNALRVFEAVARLENFTRAAQELGMTQTAVSYQVKLLEDHIGKTLFIRKPRDLQLTETGRTMLPKVAEAFSLLVEAVGTAGETHGQMLEIHSPPTFASHWLSRHFGSFQNTHPEISLKLIRHMERSDEERAPTGILIHIGAEPLPGLTCHPILTLTYSPMLNPQLAATVGGIHEPADLLKLPWISDMHKGWHDWFETIGLDQHGIRHNNLDTFGALELQANAAIGGHGVAMLSPFLFRAELEQGRLIQPFDIGCGDGKTYWLCYQPARRNTPKIKAFVTWIMAALAGERDTGRPA